jgi:putative peptidoglycan lipid II flippase
MRPDDTRPGEDANVVDEIPVVILRDPLDGVVSAASVVFEEGLPASASASPLPRTGEGLGEGSASHRKIVSSAAIIMVGNLLSSVLGFLRIETINAFFYDAITGGAFVFALRPIQQISDLLAGGSVSGALIPTFVDYSAVARRAELRRVYCTVANLVALLMIGALLGIFFAAPSFVPFETAGLGAQGTALAVRLVRIAAIALLGLGLYFVSSALLYAMKEVVAPAFATGVQHVGVIVLGVLALALALRQAGLPLTAALHTGANNPVVQAARVVGAQGLAAGLAVGALAEFVLLLPALRRIIRVWQPVLDLRHPAVRQILRLYGPVALSLVFSILGQNLDIILIYRTPGGPGQNAVSFASAQTLIQFPVGLVAVALSLAVLPALTAAANAGDGAEFKRTLRLGFRLGLLLMIPAMVGIEVLSAPIMRLLFQHGSCAAGCTERNVLAIFNMSYQLPFIALDQLLIAAFYARKNTLVPMLVGIASIVCYAAVAVPLAPVLGLPGIAFANTVQNSSHAIILFVLLTLTIGSLGLRDLGGGLLRIGVAAAGMAATCWGLLVALPLLAPGLFTPNHLTGELLTVLVAGGLGGAVYFALAALLRVEEVRMLGGLARARLGGGRR